MQSKLCLVLALVVLIGALAFGNPFRVDGVAVSLRAGSGAAAGAPPMAASPAASPAANAAAADAALASILAGDTPRLIAAPAAAQLVSLPSVPVPAIQRGDLRTDLAGKRSKRPVAAVEPKPATAVEACPDAALQPLVVRVRQGADGQPIWVLRDGRQVRRNPKTGPGEPLVVPVATGAAPGEHADEGVDR